MKSGKRPISKQAAWRNTALIVFLFLLLAGGGAAWYKFLGPGARQTVADASTQANTTPVKRGDLVISAAGSGKLVAFQSVDLSFSASGTVADVKVSAGDMVKAGQLLASLSGSDILEANLASAKLQVMQAQKALTDLQQSAGVSLAQAYSDLVAAQKTYDTALKKSQRLAYAKCSQDVTTRLTVSLENAQKRLDNIHAETKDSDVYIAAKKAYDTALANYNACAGYTTEEKNSIQAALDLAKSGLQDAQGQYDALKAASGIDPSQLAMDEAKLKEAQAQLAQAEDQLSGTTLIAPIDGKVTYLAAPAGAQVGTTKFITIADVSHATVEISVDESDLSKVVVDSPVTVTFDALPDQTFSGKVVQLNPQIVTSGQYRVVKGVVELDANAVKTISQLPLGLTASVTITNQEAKNVLLAPVISLKSLGDNSYGMMVKGANGQLRLQVVTIGIQDSDYVVITSGLKEGDQVSTGTVKFIAAGSSSSSSSLKNAQNSSGFPGGPGGAPPAP